MINELIFLTQIIVVSCTTLGALFLGKEALVAFVCTQCILANFFVLKQITLFGFNATCSDAFTIGATLGLNVLQEYFGKAITRTTITINFFLLIFYALVSQIHILYIPSSSDTTHIFFTQLLQFMPRIVGASFTVYYISQTIDYILYGFLRRVWTQKFLVIRNYMSISVSQCIDTVLFSFLGLYGIVDNIGHIILVSYTVKLIAILLATPAVAFSKYIYTRTHYTQEHHGHNTYS